MPLPDRSRFPDRLPATDRAPAREDASIHGQEDFRWPRADAGDVTERHSPGWYRELRERLERLPDAHPSSWQTSDQSALADPRFRRDEASAAGLVGADESDIWWRPHDAHQVGLDCTDRWAADGWHVDNRAPEQDAGDGWAADGAAAGAASGADDPRASVPGADAEATDGRDPGDEGAGPEEPGERPDTLKPARRTADSDDWADVGGPRAIRNPYRPWFGGGAATDPWFAKPG
jgi:hypothetical protein